jgi:hypothetical protein
MFKQNGVSTIVVLPFEYYIIIKVSMLRCVCKRHGNFNTYFEICIFATPTDTKTMTKSIVGKE